ncbi:MAG: hypothetical protein EPN72_08740 [Nevskiaceae bacterium]|nr:MAG: hypothetical protein EPN63_08080 [Nevskiaceae bacterium]TBR72529.1 MAG: hypothetical protein EPN72_08740 [Nevskiaceae bacterium]
MWGRSMRRFWRNVHRCCGLGLACFLFVNALSGSVIAFEHELDVWLNPTLFRTPGRGAALEPDRLISVIERQDPRLRVALLPLDARPGESIEVQVERRHDLADGQTKLGFDRLFVDPATGHILGKRQWGEVRFDRVHLLPMMNRLHRSMLLPGQWGRWLLGGIAIAWLGLTLVGVYLTLPAARGVRDKRTARTHRLTSSFWSRWRPAWRMRVGTRGTCSTFELHRATGLWTAAAALLLAFTGMSLNLANEIVKPTVALLSPVTPHPLSALPRLKEFPMAPTLSGSQAVNFAFDALPSQSKIFNPWYMSHIPDLGVYRVAFKEPGFRKNVGSLRYEQLYIDDNSGALRSIYGYNSGSSADRFLIWQYPLHSGKVLGVYGRIGVCLSGLLVALLCAAGVYLYWCRSWRFNL